VLLLLDPLMSRLSGRHDTHRDAEVRLALEPLAALTNRPHLAVLASSITTSPAAPIRCK
jgi:hypothetical protein